MPAIRLTSTGWLPLSALSGAPVGTAMYLQNQGGAPLLTQESATQPAATDNGGVATQPGQNLTVTNGSAQIWMRSSPSGLSLFAGGIPSGTTLTAPLTATTAQLYTTYPAASNNGKYAVVDGGQLALSNGTNWLSVTNGTVLDPVRSTPVTGVTLNTATFAGQAGGTVQLTATVAPTGAPAAVTWFTSDPAIATVSQSGLVTFVGAGTVYISVRTADGSAQAYAVGTLTALAATGVTVTAATSTPAAGATVQLTATVAPTGAAQAVTWSSNNPALAQVNQSGVVTLAQGAVGGATAVISATAANGTRGSTTLTVAGGAAAWNGVPVSNKMSELGHSFIANGQYSTDGYRSYGVATGAADDSAGAVRRLGAAGAFGNGGDSTLQIGVRTDAAIAAAQGGVVYVWNGTNDIDAGLTNDQIIAEMKVWKQKAFAAQTVMIVHTVAPRGNDAFPAARLTADQITQIKALNARMLAELPGVGFYVVDMNAQLLKSGTSFDIIDAYAPVDAKHPGNLWVQEVSGPADAAVLKSIYPAGMRDRPTGTTAASINSNVELTGASTTAGATLPTGYTSTKATGTTGTTITYQEVTTATGRWCQVVLGGTVATANAAVDIMRQISLQAKLVTGKTYEGVIEYEYDAGAAGVLSVQLGMQEAGSSTLINWDNNRYATQPMSTKARAGELRTPPFTAIDGITDHRFRLSAYLGTDVAPAATFRFRMMENREVTGV